ncbi:MAG: hypothetical protein ABGY09_06150 [Euryarchaeota archaeon]
MLAPLIAFLLLTVPVAGVRVEEYDWTITAVKLETAQGEVKVPLMHPSRVRFLVANPDYGQVEFGRDVDGDGVPDHTWCGEVAALTLYNLAVAKGFWRSTAGTDVTPLNLELRESWFTRMTGIPAEDRETDGPMAATSPPWFPALLSLASDFQDPNGIGVVIYAPLATVSRWFVIVPPALHAVLLAGVSDDGRYFVVKDCSTLQGRDYSWEKDYYLVPSYSLELNIAEAVEAISNPLQESSGAMVPVLFFPVPRTGLPEDLKPFVVGGREVDLGGGLKARFHILLASTISDVLEIARILLRNGIPVECLVRKPFASLAFTGQIVEIPLVHLRVLRILSVPVRSVVIGSGGGSGVNRPAISSKPTSTEEARKGGGEPARRRLPVPPIVPLWGGFGCRRRRRSG